MNASLDMTAILKDWPYEFIPHKPTPLQLAFCCLPQTDLLAGGAAGSGKSDAVLMNALRHVRVPGYKAVIFRKTYADLAKAGALIDRAKDWLAPHLETRTVRYNHQNHSFRFPSGAIVEFGYIGKKGSADTVQGAEWHSISIDEITQHTKTDAMWCRSRLRTTKDIDVPLSFRATANPGNIGHEWVKEYWSIIPNPEYDPKDGRVVQGHFFSKNSMFIGGNPDRPFIPARLIDNPYIKENYVESLINMDPVSKAQLLDGDWAASPTSRFKRAWFKRYVRNGDYITIGMEGSPSEGRSINLKGAQLFTTVDVAASVKDGVGGEQFFTAGGATDSAEPCWTVLSTWGLVSDGRFKYLILLDVQRAQCEAPDIFILMKEIMKKWGVRNFVVEDNGMGRPVVQVGRQQGIPIKPVWTTYDKIVNSYTAANMAKEGMIAFPDVSMKYPWLDKWENEIFTWMGFPQETSDQVDTMSTAAKEASNFMYPGGSMQVTTSSFPSTCNPSQLYRNLSYPPGS